MKHKIILGLLAISILLALVWNKKDLDNYSSSNKIDGKGIDCNFNKIDEKKTYKIMFWFNNNKVSKVEANWIRKTPYKKKMTTGGTRYVYDTDFIEMPFSIGFHYILNRKTLIIEEGVNRYSDNKWSVSRYGTCEVFKGFKKVRERQNEFIKRERAEELKRKKEYQKKLEGNKI